MKILILGAGKMGSFFADVLSFEHETAVYDIDPRKLRFIYNTCRFKELEEIREFAPELLINAVTVKYTIEAFKTVLPLLPASCIISDIASVKNDLEDFYAGCGHRFVSTHPMFGPTFASLNNLSSENAIVITESDHLGKTFFLDLYRKLWNVLKGEMSLVGPRPERRFYVERIVDQAPQYYLVYRVKPGITSLGMVKYGYADSVEKMIERLEYDLIYLKNQSLLMDLKILIFTFKPIALGKGI
jgi:hypothetical protein